MIIQNVAAGAVILLPNRKALNPGDVISVADVMEQEIGHLFVQGYLKKLTDEEAQKLSKKIHIGPNPTNVVQARAEVVAHGKDSNDVVIMGSQMQQSGDVIIEGSDTSEAVQSPHTEEPKAMNTIDDIDNMHEDSFGTDDIEKDLEDTVAAEGSESLNSGMQIQDADEAINDDLGSIVNAGQEKSVANTIKKK